VTKPLDESSNSNQSEKPYEFNNRKSGFLSKFGSAATARADVTISSDASAG